jgi:NTE family protein
VLKVLRRHGVEFDIVAGSSAGALVAVLYALGDDLGDVERQSVLLRWHEIIGWRISRHGVGDPRRFLRFLRVVTRGASLEDLPRRVLISATDLTQGTRYVFESGEAAEAIYASCALPGLFPPLRRDGRVLVDGSLLSPLPVDLLKCHGAKLSVGVSFRGEANEEPRSLFGTIRRSFSVMMDKLETDILMEADMLIRPTVGGCSLLDLRQVQRCVAEGEMAAEAALPKLLQLVEEIGPPLAGSEVTD